MKRRKVLRNNNTKEGMQTKVLNTKQKGFLVSSKARPAFEFWCDLWTLGCNQLWNEIGYHLGLFHQAWLWNFIPCALTALMITFWRTEISFNQDSSTNFCYLAFLKKFCTKTRKTSSLKFRPTVVWFLQTKQILPAAILRPLVITKKSNYLLSCKTFRVILKHRGKTYILEQMPTLVYLINVAPRLFI